VALRHHGLDVEKVDVRFGVAFDDLVQDKDSVIATVRDAETGQTEKIKCQYLVGCDGGISQVRTCLDIRYDGMARVAQLYMVHFRSDARDVLQPWGIAWHYQTSQATMIAQNDRDIWTLHTFLPPDLPLNEIDPSALCIASRDDRSHSRPSLRIPGTHTCSVAESYGRGRVFLAGDLPLQSDEGRLAPTSCWRTQSCQTGLPAAASLLTGKITGNALEKERWRELNALKS
jgi:2-polyprenyl-6-methoxyphenol hydroxylase-like FAD-dependent oxidoreductase